MSEKDKILLVVGIAVLAAAFYFYSQKSATYNYASGPANLPANVPEPSESTYVDDYSNALPGVD